MVYSRINQPCMGLKGYIYMTMAGGSAVLTYPV